MADTLMLDRKQPNKLIYVSEIIDMHTLHYETEPTIFSFPMAIYVSCEFVPLHWHNELQFCLVKSGVIEFLVNNKKYLIHEGNGIFINTDVLHSVKIHNDSNGEYTCINISPELVYGYVGSIIEKDYFKPFLDNSMLDCIPLTQDVSWEKRVLSLIEEIYVYYFKKEFCYELSIVSNLTAIWGILCLNNKKKMLSVKQSTSLEEARAKTLISFIQQNYSNKITLDHIAKAANISRGECCRFFKRYMNISPIEYLTNIRISHSLHLLQSTNLSIIQISEQVGFSSTSYFIKCFKEQMNCSPKVYRTNTQ